MQTLLTPTETEHLLLTLNNWEAIPAGGDLMDLYDPRDQYDPRDGVCGECGGTGWVWKPDAICYASEMDGMATCPVCGGEGY